MNNYKEFDKPKICCIDIDQDAIDKIELLKYPIYKGSLGTKVKVPNSMGGAEKYLLPNHDFPDNLHEFDIIIADLDNFQTTDYKIEDHLRESVSTQTSVYLLSHYPQTIFDPRPLASHILKLALDEIVNRKHLIILFSTDSYNIEYDSIEVGKGGSRQRLSPIKYNIYSMFDYPPLLKSKFGKEFRICINHSDLKIFLEKYFTDNCFYNQLFRQKKSWKANQELDDKNFIPLIKNVDGEIISYLEVNDRQNILVLPQTKDKKDLLMELLSSIAPSLFPDLFPYSSSFTWKDKKEYWLPNHAKLVNGLTQIQKKYENDISECNHLIEQNKIQYQFLHDLISESGRELVKSIIKYFNWLGYKGVKDMDSDSNNTLEEDIQIEIPEGLLIIECKGIGGTSTDSDCSQISKIKHRRCKERKKFDVYALYIVNHQRFLPPLNRKNPPFTDNQIKDAQNDERGLLTTWQLFNLYSEIENGIITKIEAKSKMLNYGLVEFRPSNITMIDKPKEFFEKGLVCIVNLSRLTVSINETIYIEKDNKFDKAKIIDIQKNDISVSTASNGEFGLKFDKKIAKNSILWKKGSS